MLQPQKTELHQNTRNQHHESTELQLWPAPMRSMHRVTRLHRISSYGTRVIRKAVGLGVQRTRNHHLHGCAVRFAGEASTSQKSKASGDDLAPAAQSNPVASTGGSESGSGDGE